MIYPDNIISKSLLAGVSIAIAGFIFVSCANPVIGAILFSLGLWCCVVFDLNLFTGKSGFLSDSQDFRRLLLVLILNIFAATAIGIIVKFTDSSIISTVDQLVNSRLNTDLSIIIIRSIITGFLMTLAIESETKTNNHIVLIFAVTAFILSGCYHCIADAFYYSVSSLTITNIGSVLARLTLTILFNFIGCIVYNLFINKSIIRINNTK